MEIKTSVEEQCVVTKVINDLFMLPHIKHMPQSLIATKANIKVTKVRAVIDDLVETGKIQKIALAEDMKRNRYFYIPTPSGLQFVAENTPKPEQQSE